ncbi:AraC family transcriptional regulator [Bradyrhizobium forestalis]|uniref:AraC family transcriptional regulator n=1 Tax=Bradyrhizobium forestalis TaxID=1419263 RepID=A0A2M8RAG8_9BRAD|nr:AraC family transcriptional regulator [Bradyrhizobium forestalis]PJG54823.1 AraC family transcriptional regulator [Bradyrhizobium forestalis]
MSAAEDFSPRRFTTDQLPENERLARWREEFGRTLVRVDIEPLPSDIPFRAEAVLQNLPGVRLALCGGSEARLHRTRALAADGGDWIGLFVNLGEAASVSQRGRELVLREGDAVIVRPDEPALFSATKHLHLLFPRAALAVRTNDIAGAVMRPISHGASPLRLLLGYLHLIQGEPGLDETALRQAAVNHIHDLAALVIGPTRDARQQARGGAAAARLSAAIELIGRSFTDPELSLAHVAERQGISPRYLQELLEKSGASFTARVNELRLKRAFALLTKFPDRPVSEIAAQVGYSNVSHFNRLFRQRFGDRPSGVRGRF